jgi:CubicO group peptidase (beta-lactamase class C family)
MSLKQSDLNDVIAEQSALLMDSLRSRTNRAGENYGVAVAFAAPNYALDPFYFLGDHEWTPTKDSIFAIGSVTKTFTATLFANGVARWPDSFDWQCGLEPYLRGYLGGMNQKLSRVMQEMNPAMLARHMSGLPKPTGDSQDGVGLFQTCPAATPPDSLRHRWENYTQSYQPGSCWQYSNLGFITLGFAALAAYGYGGLAAGQPTDIPFPGVCYPDVLKEYITDPLKMSSTMTIVPDGAPVVIGYPNNGTVSAADASDIKASTKDMHTWMMAHLQPPPDLNEYLTAALRSTVAASSLRDLYPLYEGADCSGATGPALMGLSWDVKPLHPKVPGTPNVIWKNGLTELGGCACWVGMIFEPEPMGIAVLVNAYFDDTKQNIVPDPYGLTMLRKIAGAATGQRPLQTARA